MKDTKVNGRRKVSSFNAMNMKRMVNAGKKTVSEIAAHYGVTPYTVRYNTDEAFRNSEIVRCSKKASKKK